MLPAIFGVQRYISNHSPIAKDSIHIYPFLGNYSVIHYITRAENTSLLVLGGLAVLYVIGTAAFLVFLSVRSNNQL